jgi:aminoglycoside/choline kinase family phosphotransferase
VSRSWRESTRDVHSLTGSPAMIACASKQQATNAMTQIEKDLTDWLGASALKVRKVHPLAGDVSRRLYYRIELSDGDTLIAVWYPVDMRSGCSRFLATSRILVDAGVRIPRIVESACERGVMLVEDIGDRSLYDLAESSWSDLQAYFRRALSELDRIQAIPVASIRELNPALDAPALRRELDLCWAQLLDHPTAGGPPSLRQRLRRALDTLCAELESAPLVPCHRDFMARNLLVPGTPPEVVVIDHQDLRLGPKQYDLASLLNDSLFPPEAVEKDLRSANIHDEHDLLLYRRCAVQRTLKAADTYVRFARLGDCRHLRLVRPTLARAARHLLRLPEGADFAHELEGLWRSLESESLVEGQPQ